MDGGTVELLVRWAELDKGMVVLLDRKIERENEKQESITGGSK